MWGGIGLKNEMLTKKPRVLTKRYEAGRAAGIASQPVRFSVFTRLW